ncbi:MAG: tRNA pseudouridine(55) synthase TruB [Clostridia bacterium]|nr:tRNA pseudouridine(55) synthase TruB [Clostridia bacterium]
MNGVIIINKSKGYTSHDVVNIVKKQLNIKKVGHTGTLDPNATGVLPILIGNATKISKYLVEHKKTYIAVLKLGQKTDTGDVEGKIIEVDANFNKIDIKQIEKVLHKFLGKQKQTPPMYSAIKIGGKKLYEYARQGQTVEVKPRDIEIYSILLKKYDNIDEITFEVECTKGTYIRVLCEDIAKELGTVGFMQDLERTKVDKFNIENSIVLNELNAETIGQKLIAIEEIFIDKNKLELNGTQLKLFLNGVKLTYKLKDDLYRIYNKNIFIGLGIVNNNLLKRDVVI